MDTASAATSKAVPKASFRPCDTERSESTLNLPLCRGWLENWALISKAIAINRLIFRHNALFDGTIAGHRRAEKRHRAAEHSFVIARNFRAKARRQPGVRLGSGHGAERIGGLRRRGGRDNAVASGSALGRAHHSSTRTRLSQAEVQHVGCRSDDGAHVFRFRTRSSCSIPSGYRSSPRRRRTARPVIRQSPCA